MADALSGSKPSKARSRQSIAHIPSSRNSALKDNVTTDIAALQAQHNVSPARGQRSRGKSIGPGGLEALTESSGNIVKTTAPVQIKSILKPSIPLTPPKAIPTFDELRKRSTGKGRSPGKPAAEDLLIDFSTPGPSRQEGAETSMSGTANVADPFSPMTRRSPRRQEVTNTETLEREREEERKRKADKQAILERRAARRKSLANRRVSFAPEATLHTWSVMELAEDSTTSSASNSTRRQSSMTVQQSPVKAIKSSEAQTVPSTPAEQIDDLIVEESPGNQRDLHQRKRRRRSSGGPDVILDASQDEVFFSSPSGDESTTSSPVRVEEGIESSDDSDSDGDTAMSMDDATSHTVTSQESGSSTPSSLEERLRQAAQQAGTAGIHYDEHGEDLSMEIVDGTVTNAFQPWARNQNVNHENDTASDPETNNAIDPAQLSTSHTAAAEEVEEESQLPSEDMSMDVTKAVGAILTSHSPRKKEQKSPKGRRRSIRPRRSSGAESAYDETMEFTRMQGGILGTVSHASAADTSQMRGSDDDMTMEVTKAFGGVLSSAARRESIASEQDEDNETMDMTAAVGTILPSIDEDTEPLTDAGDQTMAMEMTKAVGAILKQSPAKQRMARQSVGDMQHAYIMEEEQTMAMEMTRPVGSILNQGSPGRRLTAQSAETATTPPQPQSSERTTPKSTPKSQLHMTSVASETGSPSRVLKPQMSGKSQRSMRTASTTPQTNPKTTTPVKSPSRLQAATPSKQVTPLPHRATTPNKTPASANVTHRGASPKKLFRAEIKARASPASAKRAADLKAKTLFSRDAETGQQTPSVVLRAPRPQFSRRRSSGIGIDRDGIGSPRVSEILDRRASIGDAAADFKLGSTAPAKLRFEDPVQLEQEVEAERNEDHRQESGRFIMEQEADGSQEETATLQIKEMIETMSPRKEKAGKGKARKSLAVGGAKGLLGKRPAELDMDDEDDVESTPKRLKAVSREGSPVKKIHLPKPPSKDETTGRLSARLQQSLAATAGSDVLTPKLAPPSPGRTTAAASPAAIGRFKDVPVDEEERPTSFEDKLDNVVGAIDVSTAQLKDGFDQQEEEKISLQEFLNMTNIHFIELSTTKRRHTMAQLLPADGLQEPAETSSTETNFVAAATTLPMLELYQHATRELKSYISTGRKIIRTIEAETLAEQPPLFREYLDARPDVKLVMDNQFRNGKANARLQSKEGWYQWRGQLVEGLKAGLEGIKQGMVDDLNLLQQQEQVLNDSVPRMLQEHDRLQKQQESFQQSVEELDNIDHEALADCRSQLRNADAQYLQRSTLLNALQLQMTEKDEALSAAAEMKTEMQDQIAEADRVRDELKGWPVADVVSLKSRVDNIQKQTGWRLLTAETEVEEPDEFGPALVMRYKDELRLFFYPQAFQCRPSDARRRRSGRKSASVSGPSAPISLLFAPGEEEDIEAAPQELPTEKRFFLQLIRSQLHGFAMMPKGSITPRTLLSTVSEGWEIACKVSKELKLLRLTGITTTSILGDERLGIKVMLVIPGQGRVDIGFTMTVTILNDGDFMTSVGVTADAIHGSAVNTLAGKNRKIQTALGKEVESRTLGEGAWINAIHGFQDWLSSQSKVKDEGTQATTNDSAVAASSPSPVSASGPARPAAEPAAPIIAPSPPAPAPVAIKRSPLAPKRANMVQKKSLPVSKQRLEKLNAQQLSQALDKENFNPSLSVSSKGQESARPAIPPEMQEVMMHTPIKRVGALRRSPI
ncbi:hypothetical protein LTR10_019423 [Elasticomyces elasticus]|uniref:Spc7 kinetochore protein domain-containing protein n=1 Tax=Exophiala sideris TaxID=1016849 RepID=A0ABR0J2M6_9EURO|nr:hypothetical protein LTR10_019423 [Elasticomyces elasticus]KAK5024099.1 hypothetical protein LTS07_008833 [Exophiala sideris]KAK5029039.1 hypothetical protein LTR13_008910 [Exophiala sideris]KAK5054811.1 hypothetical protein LTR69_008718 [Exophiala sideris]KAK5178862.1 hypothetical protein LTR44_008691 [Eurotiomycetes sp. CCFEE 6388]